MLFFMFSGLFACTGKPVNDPCPIEMIPPSIVVRYGDSFSANCSSLNQQDGLGWESPIGGTGLMEGVTSVLLEVKTVNMWVIEPICFFTGRKEQCSHCLPITIYKMADNVSMSLPVGPMVEGKTYRLQCDVANVAPASHLHVFWHKGNQIIHTESFKNESSPSPVSVSSVTNMIAYRDDNGARIWCEAKLNLGPFGPDLPALESKSHDLHVLYPPIFIEPEKEMVTLTGGGKKSLNCTAAGNPTPLYRWHLPHPIQPKKNKDENQPVLTISYPGTYTCTVSNTQGNSTKYFIVTTASRNHTTLAAVIGVFLAVAALLVVANHLFGTPQGTFSFRKGSNHRGQST
ncbi:hypothetical protein PAMA_009639 [Pampus argenteus]